jgi:hypothetical protein
MPIPIIFLGETFIDGQQRDVWCDSKIPITDMRMHWGGRQHRQGTEIFNKASCYIAYQNTIQRGLILYGDSCQLNAMEGHQTKMFLCA